MRLHILGIGGTFMSGLAILAKESGFEVSGCDADCYPPVSDLLHEKGIAWIQGYAVSPEALEADWVIVGNAMKRGMPVLEAVINQGKNYISGPQWLAETILTNYRVLAVSGTHGKTSTTSMIAFILERANFAPGFLIGGVASNFQTNARLGRGEWFVIEADEYDSAYFDKRPKFMHYKPEIAVLTNLEFDHADIYPNLAAIEQQFHYYIKTIPQKGLIIKPRDDSALQAVLERGVYSPVENIATTGRAEWRADLRDESGSSFDVYQEQECVARVNWSLIGQFNVENGLSAIAACARVGIPPEQAAAILQDYIAVKRRLECLYSQQDIAIYDDFAHHPTAIAKTIEALTKSGRHQRIIVVMEFASYTMRCGLHADSLEGALSAADVVFMLSPKDFNISERAAQWVPQPRMLLDTDTLIAALLEEIKTGDGVVVMSNRGFDNLHQRLIAGLCVR